MYIIYAYILLYTTIYTYINMYIIQMVTLWELDFHFLSNWMEYDRDDSFPFEFEPNGLHEHTPFNLKGNKI